MKPIVMKLVLILTLLSPLTSASGDDRSKESPETGRIVMEDGRSFKCHIVGYEADKDGSVLVVFESAGKRQTVRLDEVEEITPKRHLSPESPSLIRTRLDALTGSRNSSAKNSVKTELIPTKPAPKGTIKNSRKETVSGRTGFQDRIAGLRRTPIDMERPAPIESNRTFSSEKDAARWILSMGGIVHVKHGEGYASGTTAGKVEDLPSGPVQITIVSLTVAKRWSDDDQARIKGLTNLKMLVLSKTSISDEGLEHLSSLTNLEMLDLRKTDISDEGLEHLNGLTNLKVLKLAKTKTSLVGIETLKEKLKGCKVIH